jgi:hypothetical protein
MSEPRNEEHVCHAVVRLIAQRDGGPAIVTDRPDKTERQRQAVEMLFESPTARYAMEHTRIESFPGQIVDGVMFSRLLEPLEKELTGRLPGRYSLTVGVGATDGIRASDQQRIRELVKRWIMSKAESLDTRGAGSVVTEQPPGVPFAITLLRSSLPGSRMVISRSWPDALEEQRLKRVQTALARKCPKLAEYKAENRQTVLVLESDDIGLGCHGAIREAVAKAVVSRDDVPDRIFLAETETRPWFVWALKEGADVYPSQRLLDYEPFEVN